MNVQSPTVALRAALYLRVSTGRQADSDLSIPDQRRQIEGYCLSRGWEVAAEFVEPGNTATDDRRPAFQAMIDTGYADVVRPHTNEPRTYTYWDYTQLRFPKKQGMRIDFALCSPALAGRVQGAVIDRDERKGKGASDHAPVIVQLD